MLVTKVATRLWLLHPGGPALPDGDAGEFELSGKIGGSVQASAVWCLWRSQVSFMTGDDDASYGTKLGAKVLF